MVTGQGSGSRDLREEASCETALSLHVQVEACIDRCIDVKRQMEKREDVAGAEGEGKRKGGREGRGCVGREDVLQI